MGLSKLDLGIVLLYILGVTVFGLRFRSGRQTLKGYFLADNAIPWWAISLSIVAAETSTLDRDQRAGTGLRWELHFSPTGVRISDRARTGEFPLHSSLLCAATLSPRTN